MGHERHQQCTKCESEEVLNVDTVICNGCRHIIRYEQRNHRGGYTTTPRDADEPYVSLTLQREGPRGLVMRMPTPTPTNGYDVVELSEPGQGFQGFTLCMDCAAKLPIAGLEVHNHYEPPPVDPATGD